MVRKAIMALAIGAALVGAVGTRASAQVVSARVIIGAPAVYAGVVVGAPGPGYLWDARFHRWCYRGVAWRPDHYRAPVAYGWAPRPEFRPRFAYHRDWR
jgi:hypothetical protein